MIGKCLNKSGCIAVTAIRSLLGSKAAMSQGILWGGAVPGKPRIRATFRMTCHVARVAMT